MYFLFLNNIVNGGLPFKPKINGISDALCGQRSDPVWDILYKLVDSNFYTLG
jgi:hypothetical protein